MRGRERIEGQNQQQERLGREKDGERPRGPRRKREKKDKQGRRHLKEKKTSCVLTSETHSGKLGRKCSGPCVFTFCVSGCLTRRLPSPVRGPGAGSGTVGRGLRMDVPQGVVTPGRVAFGFCQFAPVGKM